jgi:hypothetical protein
LQSKRGGKEGKISHRKNTDKRQAVNQSLTGNAPLGKKRCFHRRGSVAFQLRQLTTPACSVTKKAGEPF